MRRSVGLLCAAALLAVPSATSAALVSGEPGLVADEEAVASWLFPTDRPHTSEWLFAGAYRSAVAGGKTVTTGFAVRGSCEVERERGQKSTTCHGRGVGGRLPDSAFEVDPALRAARLVLRADGATHRLSWVADAYAAPNGYFAGEACDAGTGQGAGSMRHASARGELFDRALDGAGIDHAVLSRGAMLTECTSDGTSLATVARRAAAGKTVTITFR